MLSLWAMINDENIFQRNDTDKKYIQQDKASVGISIALGRSNWFWAFLSVKEPALTFLCN